jgi:hypothetical protein
LRDDGSVVLGLNGGGQIALDSSWQSTDIELFLRIADKAIVQLLRPTSDKVFIPVQSPSHGEDTSATQEALRYRLSIDGYVAGRILLHSVNRRLDWPPHESERWRREIMNHRLHQTSLPFRSAGARLHVHQVAMQVHLENERDLIAQGISVFRSGFADAIAERVLEIQVAAALG